MIEILIGIGSLLLCAFLARWIFRINDIIETLKKINLTLETISKKLEKGK